MLKISLLLAVFSYLILALGLIGHLNTANIFLVSIITCLLGYFFIGKKFPLHVSQLFERKNSFFIITLFFLSLVNLVGALGPELAFDALWYHLTIPKMFLLHQKIYFIQGNLLYYNLLPKLTEMLYVSILPFGGEIGAKLIHYCFGLLTSVALYLLAREFLNKKWSILSVTVFYSNLVVMWLSITAFSDLPRSFFETSALLYFIRYTKKRTLPFMISSAFLMGLAISTKVISLTSVPIFVFLLMLIEKDVGEKLKKTFLFIALTILVPMPWFILSYVHTKNPIYPLLSSVAPSISLSNLNPTLIVKNLVDVFFFSSDPISPLYILLLPVVYVASRTMKNKFSILYWYSFLSLSVWYCATFLGFWHATEAAGSARFLTSYLPAYSLLGVASLSCLKKGIIKKVGVSLILAVAFISICYRTVANARYLPVLLGFQTKEQFLMKNLNFSFGDFYDEHSTIKKIVGTDTVELVNMHNLYYVDFPFTVSEFKENTKAKFILVQNGELPSEYKDSELVYQNKNTHVKLYKLK